MSIFNSIFGPNKEKLEKEKKEKEELERLEKEKRDREEQERLEIEKKEKEELERVTKEKKEKYMSLISELDKDNNGIIDLVQVDDYTKILKKHQEKIIEINRDYVQQFVQVSNYLKTKRNSLQSVFEILVKTINEGGTYTSFHESIDFHNYSENSKLSLVKKVKEVTGCDLQESKDIVNDYFNNRKKDKNGNYKYFKTINDESVNTYFGILNDDIHLYNVLLVYSFNMIESLINNDMISFYEIYERFDELNMFDKKHERDLISQLDNLNEGLGDVMNQIEIMGQKIVSSIGDLSMITEESTLMIKEGLESVESSINTNNLINTIQTYQMYKLRKGN